MVKRTKDLFRLLEQREHGRRGGQAEGGSRRAAAGGVLERLGLVETEGRRGRGTGAGTALLTGPGVAAVAVVCLGLGFLLGRALPQGESTGDLAARREAAAAGLRPGPVEPRTPPAAAWPAQKEEEQVSSTFFPLLVFDIDQRGEAAAAAAYLRSHHVESARICRTTAHQGRAKVWVVLAYVPAEQTPQDLLDRIRAVPPHASWSPADVAQVANLKLEQLCQASPP